MKEVAVDGCTFKYTINAVPPSYSLQDPADGQITTPASVKCKAGGSGIFKDSSAFMATLMAPPTSIGGVVNPPQFPLTGSFISTAVKTKADMQAVLLKGDQTAPMVANFVDTNSSSGVSVPIAVTVIAEIDDAGQDKVVSN